MPSGPGDRTAGDETHPHDQLRRAWLTVAAATAAFLLLVMLPGAQVDLTPWLVGASHNLLETMSIVVSV